MAKTNRNGAIDFLRFFFCVIIVLRHSMHALPEGGYVIMPGGAMGVEFFFIVSGYLLACSAFKRINNGNPIDTAADTNIFMKRKVGSLMPDLAIAGVCSIICYSITLIPQGAYEMLIDFSKKIWNPILLSAAGFGSTNELWYLSAMIIVMLVYYPIMLRHFQVFVRIAAPLIAMFSLGYIDRAFDSILDPSYFLGFIYKGMVRAIGEIALGAALFPLIQALSKQKLTNRAKNLVSLGSILSYSFAFLIMTFRDTKMLDLLCVLFITTGTLLTFSHQGRLADKFDNKVSAWLGRISLTLYLSHRWVAVSLNNIYNGFARRNWFGLGKNFDFDYAVVLVTYLICSVIACTVIYLISKYIRNHREELRAKFRKKYIAE